jgi:EmrB/QacA subfamily drug resistance transporter
VETVSRIGLSTPFEKWKQSERRICEMLMKLKERAKRLSAKFVAIKNWRPSEIFWLLACLMCLMLVAALDGTMFNTALSTIVGELHGVSLMQWVGTIYLMASMIMLPIYGKLGDFVDRKKLIVGAMVIFLLGSVVGGLAPNMTVLIIGRGIQGIGAGGLMSLAFTILAIRFSPTERMKYSGAMMSVFMIVSLIGPFMGGLLTEEHHIGTITAMRHSLELTTSWRWAFWLNIPLGVVAIALARKFMPRQELPAVRPKVDKAGIALLTIISTVLVLISSWGGAKYAWGSPVILLLAVGVGMAIGVFVWVEIRVEQRGDHPFLPMSMFNMRKYRDFTLVSVAGIAVGVAMFGVIGYIPTYIQMVTGFSASMSGLLTLPMMICMMVMSQVLARTLEKVDGFKYQLSPPLGIGIMALSLFLLSTMTPTTSVWLLCSYLALMGAGLGLSMQLLMTIAQNTFPLSMTGTVTGINQYFRQTGSTFGVSGVGTAFVTFLATQFAIHLPGIPLNGGGGATLTPAAVQAMPHEMKTGVIVSYNDALTSVFHILVWVVVAAAVLTLGLTGQPLRKSNEEEAVIETMELVGAPVGVMLPEEVPTSEKPSKRFHVRQNGRHRARGRHRHH